MSVIVFENEDYIVLGEYDDDNEPRGIVIAKGATAQVLGEDDHCITDWQNAIDGLTGRILELTGDDSGGEDGEV